jgi:hypothetical protein
MEERKNYTEIHRETKEKKRVFGEEDCGCFGEKIRQREDCFLLIL